jgi:hypothetical protein
MTWKGVGHVKGRCSHERIISYHQNSIRLISMIAFVNDKFKFPKVPNEQVPPSYNAKTADDTISSQVHQPQE